MKVSILLFGPARLAVKAGETALDLPSSANLNQALQILFQKHPELEVMKSSLRYAIGTDYGEGMQVLKEGDTIAVIPPVQGG